MSPINQKILLFILINFSFITTMKTFYDYPKVSGIAGFYLGTKLAQKLYEKVAHEEIAHINIYGTSKTKKNYSKLKSYAVRLLGGIGGYYLATNSLQFFLPSHLYENNDPSENIVFVSNVENLAQAKNITLYLHGYGEDKSAAQFFKENQLLSGSIVSFDFVDVTSLGKIKSNFGQLGDVLRALTVINHLKDKEKINLFGRSRGGAVLINMLAVLHDKTDRYDNHLLTIGISKSRRIELLELLQKGSHVITCPLLTLKSVIGHAHHLLPCISDYSVYGLEALQTVHLLAGLKLDITLHFQRNDTVVGNHYDILFYQVLKSFNPDTTKLIYDEDNHNDFPLNLSNYLKSKIF